MNFMENVSFEYLGMWIMAMAAVIVLVDRIWNIIERTRGKWEPAANPPLHKAYAAREDYDKLSARVERIHGEMRDGFEAMGKDRLACQRECAALIDRRVSVFETSTAASRDKLHDAVDALRVAVTDVAAQGRQHASWLVNLDRKIDRLLSEKGSTQ